MRYVPWEQAWREALYGPDGFFRRPEGLLGHFRTASTSPALAEALTRLAAYVERALHEPADFTVVDVGAGRGELLSLLASLAPEHWRLVGVEVVGRPSGLPERISWVDAAPRAVTGLLIAHELLDAVPCPVVERDLAGDVRLVLVDRWTGSERLGPIVDHPDAAWLERWWPIVEPGLRAEVGSPREDVWRSLVGSMRAGVAVAVDYAHSRDDRTTEELAYGTLAGYREGMRVPPVPDGSCDITAHVALDACSAATPGGWTLLTRQADVLPLLGVTSTLPGAAAIVDPGAYALGLAARSRARVLLDPDGPGGFGWLLQAVRMMPP
jgi:SAM-dependent MidA family methyltransferase